MGITDIIILIIIGVFGIKGVFKGLVSEVFGMMGLILGYVLAYQFYPHAAKLMSFIGLSQNIADKVGFVIMFLAVYIIVLVVGIVLKKFFKAIQLGWADRTGGFFFGAVKAAVILSIILTITLTIIPSSAKMHKDLKKSMISSYLLSITPMVFELLNKLPSIEKENPFVK